MLLSKANSLIFAQRATQLTPVYRLSIVIQIFLPVRHSDQHAGCSDPRILFFGVNHSRHESRAEGWFRCRFLSARQADHWSACLNADA
jgi:hypothetical protein